MEAEVIMESQVELCFWEDCVNYEVRVETNKKRETIRNEVDSVLKNQK